MQENAAGQLKVKWWSHRWQEMKYFWHRSFVITTSADSTLSRKPAEVPTIFLSLQNLATSLVVRLKYPLDPDPFYLYAHSIGLNSQWNFGRNSERAPSLIKSSSNIVWLLWKSSSASRMATSSSCLLPKICKGYLLMMAKNENVSEINKLNVQPSAASGPYLSLTTVLSPFATPFFSPPWNKQCNRKRILKVLFVPPDEPCVGWTWTPPSDTTLLASWVAALRL